VPLTVCKVALLIPVICIASNTMLRFVEQYSSSFCRRPSSSFDLGLLALFLNLSISLPKLPDRSVYAPCNGALASA